MHGLCKCKPRKLKDALNQGAVATCVSCEKLTFNNICVHEEIRWTRTFGHVNSKGPSVVIYSLDHRL